MARALFLSAAAPRLVIDPRDSSLTAIDGAVTFRDPRRPPADAATARFVPVDPYDLDAYDAVYAWAFDRFPRYIWLDEAGMVAPAKGAPKAARALIVQGGKRMIGHIACHTRPREVDRNLIAQAQHVLVFDLPNPDDRRHVAELIGQPAGVIDAALASLGPYEFLWWDQLRRELVACPALRRR